MTFTEFYFIDKRKSWKYRNKLYKKKYLLKFVCSSRATVFSTGIFPKNCIKREESVSILTHYTKPRQMHGITK